MMNPKSAFETDDRGVSPVIGVILMVAITVILAAVIGTFVLNLGGDLQQTPQAQLSVEKQAGDVGTDLVLEHNGGDALQAGDFRIESSTGSPGIWADELNVGGSYKLIDDASPGEYTITVIHEPSDSILIESTLTVA